MANRTDPLARAVHGTNPQNLIEKILRMKIYGARYWKEECFGLTAETLVDKSMDLKYVGGTYGGNRKPTKILCLILKMLQLQPEKEIIIEFIKNEEYKYVRALGAFYLRLVGKPSDIYQYLEPLYNDYRKLRVRTIMSWEIKHMDEFIDGLLRDEYCCDLALPHLPKRQLLEDAMLLEPRRSALEEDWEDDDLDADEEEEEEYDEDDVRKYVEARYKKLNVLKTSDKGRLEAAIAAGLRGEERERSLSPIKKKDPRKERDTRKEKERARDKDREKEGRGRKDRKRSVSKERDKRDRKLSDRKRSRSRSREREKDREKKRKQRSRSRDRRHNSPSQENFGSGKTSRGDKKRSGADKLFKKGAGNSGQDEGYAGKADDTEYWNDMRAKLGLKPLKK